MGIDVVGVPCIKHNFIKDTEEEVVNIDRLFQVVLARETWILDTKFDLNHLGAMYIAMNHHIPQLYVDPLIHMQLLY